MSTFVAVACVLAGVWLLRKLLTWCEVCLVEPRAYLLRDDSPLAPFNVCEACVAKQFGQSLFRDYAISKGRLVKLEASCSAPK